MRSCFLAFAALATVACSGNNHHGGLSYPDMAPSTANNDAALSGGGCSDRAKLVYVVESNGMLSSFAPDKLTFTNLGMINCGNEVPGSVNSMAIDRDATAWVNYQSGAVYRVDTQTLACQATKFKSNPAGFSTFGMGFSSNAIGSTDETLFIAGGQGGMPINNHLGRLDLATMSPMIIGTLPAWPELTGTGDAKLWGFFPGQTGAKVALVDKLNASLGTTYPLPQLDGTQKAWAFAFWGGDFWIFLKRDTDPSTHVWHLAIFDAGMNVTDALPNTGREIVGAGVSTCAPLTIG